MIPNLKQPLTLIGMQVDDFIIEDRIAEGSFAWIYRGSGITKPGSAAFKIAKPVELFNLPVTNFESTQAKVIFEGGVADVVPDTTELLNLQVEHIGTCPDFVFPSGHPVLQKAGLAYYQMELIQGQTLTELQPRGSVCISIFLDLAKLLDRLQSNKCLHGNLKPENIMVTDNGIKLLDPGYFGLLDCREGDQLDVAVTTPAYYPLLEADDMLAFGIMLWEAITGKHPLEPKGTSSSNRYIGESLNQWVNSYKNVGQYFLAPLLGLQPPHIAYPNLDPKLHHLLLKALRLRLGPNDILEKDQGYKDFAEIVTALHDVLQ